jgi:two-component system NtrC family sensor kinase
MRFLHTLGFRVLGGSFILLLVLFGLFEYVTIRYQTDQMMSYVMQSANQMSDIIKNSTRYSMLLNRREDVYETITSIGNEPGVVGIRIYNKRGEIMFSTTKSEEQSVVDMHAEACYVCHEQAKPLESLPSSNRARIYALSDSHRVLGLINPIRNEPSCSDAACHAHPADRTVLGVLDVRMSLDGVDRDIRQAETRMILYGLVALAIIGSTSLLFLYQTVHRPVKRLTRGTEEISSGNLDFRIPIVSKDEIGQLAQSFNAMTVSLKREEEENRRWSRELEIRIREKTTELRRIHDQILQIEKMASLGKLSATVAHELNNPLEGILTYAKLMAKRLRKSPEQSDTSRQMLEELDLIIHETMRCGTIVKNLLLFSRKQVGDFGVAPVKTIVDRAAQLVQHHFQISNVRFASRCETEPAILLCDENQIQQALVALFVNAVEAMPDGGTLTVEVRRAGGELVIEVSDTGMGIAEEDVAHIFEPFFTTKKDGKGVGLGLSVVYGIVERHGGKITVRSAPGLGTTFVLAFREHPSATNEAPATAAAGGAPHEDQP